MSSLGRNSVGWDCSCSPDSGTGGESIKPGVFLVAAPFCGEAGWDCGDFKIERHQRKDS
jgi:hypothetical protein